MLDWWIPHLIPILEKFLKAYDGEQDEMFWNCSYKAHYKGGSGGYTSVNGWINTFFPYIKEHQYGNFPPLEKLFEEYKAKGEVITRGVNVNSVPTGLTITPFVWKYYGKEIKMSFIGGFSGIKCDEDEFVTPHIGWAVAEEAKEVEEKTKNSMDD